MSGYIDCFIDFCKTQRMSPNTIRVYKGDLERFCEWEDINRSPQQVTRKTIANYVSHLSKKKLSPATIRNKTASLSSFFDWAVSEEIVNANPTKGVRLPKIPARVPDFIPRSDLIEIIERVDGDDFISLRDRAILELGYAGAMRVSDLRGANWRNIDFDRMRIKVIGKGDKQVWVQFGEAAKEALVRYLKRRVKEGYGGKEDALFINVDGERLSTIDKIVKKYTGKYPHAAFRSSGATHFALAGADIRTVQDHLRHSSLTSTTKYVGMEEAHFKDQYFSRYPRARYKGGVR